MSHARPDPPQADIAQTLETQAGVEYESKFDPQTPAEVAHALVYNSGFILLFSSIEVLCRGEGGRKAKRRVDKDLTATGGARAAVILTIAVARALDDLPDEYRGLVKQHFPVPSEDTDFLDHAFEKNDRLTGFGAAVISAKAVEIASGFSAARGTPAFRELGEIDLRELDFDTALAGAWGPAADGGLQNSWSVSQGNFVRTVSDPR